MCNTQDAAKSSHNSYPYGLGSIEDHSLDDALHTGTEMALHGLNLGFLPLLGILTDHAASLAVPLVQLLLLGVLYLPAVVLAVDGALAQLAGQDVISLC
jgi:hypothetical protein